MTNVDLQAGHAGGALVVRLASKPSGVFMSPRTEALVRAGARRPPGSEKQDMEIILDPLVDWSCVSAGSSHDSLTRRTAWNGSE